MSDTEYKLKSGIIVDINNLSNLNAEDRIELFETPFNLYEGLLLKNDLSEIKVSLSDALAFIKNHDSICPVSKSSIISTIDSRLKTNIKESILTSGNIAKAITAIFFLVAGFGALFFLIIQQLK
ncbi:MAG: hypothetical protein KKF62_01975 [Bacteroidetes bacterium]|nr:hypothetical protein [Bacteroidota bacterium]MBU1115332.1 hypothetical protein [Bacteroidota bacterium]MBU1799679.1 hypothetical protein [Bacteroidota bacterium]